MEASEERIARNEVALRIVNRKLEQLSEELGEGKESELEILCECGRDDCRARLLVSIAQYETAHQQRDRFMVAPGHENPQIERVVERNDAYLVVDKFGRA